MSVGATSLLTEGDVDRGRPLDVAPSAPQRWCGTSAVSRELRHTVVVLRQRNPDGCCSTSGDPS